MAKKLNRTYRPTFQNLEKVIDRDVHLTLNNKAVYFGVIKTVKLNEIVFRDKINNKHAIPIKDIMEMIIDEKHFF